MREAIHSKKTVIVLGATGVTGSILLDNLLHDRTVEKVKVFTRSATRIQHAKLEEHIMSLFQLKNHADLFQGDAVFCCIARQCKND